ncbi:MAG: metallophosphoesterase family protein [Methanocellales archaeon]|nr:metallophosphoesterase family protein [Methanocellales archaeon]
MRVLVIADTHGNFSKIPAILERAGEVDAILVAGDMTNFGPDRKARELLDVLVASCKRVMAVPGNCDPRGVLKVIQNSGLISLHDSALTLNDITFIGLGGSNPTPFGTPFELSEAEIKEILSRLLGKASGRIVLLSHAPPRNTLDATAHGNVGSVAIREILDYVDLVICGHIHEARGIQKVGDTLIVNPGPAAKGFAALITINKEIKTELIGLKMKL